MFATADCVALNQLKEKTAGPGWFDLPAPDAADLPRLYREVEALRLRNTLDPKRFYRKDPGEGKGVKGLPKHFSVCLRIIQSYLPSNLLSRLAKLSQPPRPSIRQLLLTSPVQSASAL